MSRRHAGGVLADNEEIVKGKKNRNTEQRDLGIALTDAVVAVFSNPIIYELGRQVSGPPKAHGGRPRAYPFYLFFGLAALNNLFGSNRAAVTQFHDSELLAWNLIRKTVATYRDAQPSGQCIIPDLPVEPPHRTWFAKTRDRYDLAEEAERYIDVYRKQAMLIATEVNGFNTESGAPRHHPAGTDVIHADGKVLTPITSNPRGATRTITVCNTDTGELTDHEVPARFDPDAKTHVVGDGTQVHGNKFWMAASRSDAPHSTVIVDLALVPSAKGASNSENHIAVQRLTQIAAEAPNVRGVVLDNVLGGRDREELIRDTGLLVIQPATAAKINKATGERLEKEGKVSEVTFAYDDGTTQTVEIHHYAGALRRLVIDADGNRSLEPLRRTANPSRTNKDGTHRDYVEYEVPDPRGGSSKTIRERTITNAEDRARKFNRSELIHQIPPGDPDHDRLYPRRENAEAINNRVDAALYRERAHSYGARRQLLDLLGFAILETSKSYWYHQQDESGRLAA